MAVAMGAAPPRSTAAARSLPRIDTKARTETHGGERDERKGQQPGGGEGGRNQQFGEGEKETPRRGERMAGLQISLQYIPTGGEDADRIRAHEDEVENSQGDSERCGSDGGAEPLGGWARGKECGEDDGGKPEHRGEGKEDAEHGRGAEEREVPPGSSPLQKADEEPEEQRGGEHVGSILLGLLGVLHAPIVEREEGRANRGKRKIEEPAEREGGEYDAPRRAKPRRGAETPLARTEDGGEDARDGEVKRRRGLHEAVVEKHAAPGRLMDGIGHPRFVEPEAAVHESDAGGERDGQDEQRDENRAAGGRGGGYRGRGHRVTRITGVVIPRL